MKLHCVSALLLRTFPFSNVVPLPQQAPSPNKSISDVIGAIRLTSRRPHWMERPVVEAGQTPPPKRSRFADQSPPPKMEHHIAQPEPNIKSQASTKEAVYVESEPEEPEEPEQSLGVMEELMTNTWHEHRQGSNLQDYSYGCSNGRLLCRQDHISLQDNSYGYSPNMAPMDASGSEKEYGDIVPEVRPQGEVHQAKARLRLSTLCRPKAAALQPP